MTCCASTTTSPAARTTSPTIIGDPHFEALRHDITFPLYAEVDEIYNLACPASPIHYQDDPVQTTKTSVIGAINMLGLAKRVGAKILQASTSEVYGDPTVHPQSEDYRGNVNPLGPRACYDEGKRCAETLFFDYQRQHHTRIKVPRIFNTYGPRMHPNDGRVVSNFIMQALRAGDITLYGDRQQTRAFCYVDDLIEGLIRLMATDDHVTGPINLGNPHEIPVAELAGRIVRLTNSRSRIVHSEPPQDDPQQRCPDIGLARRLHGWEPRVALDDGLNRTIAYFDRMLVERSGKAGYLGRLGRIQPAVADAGHESRRPRALPSARACSSDRIRRCCEARGEAASAHHLDGEREEFLAAFCYTELALKLSCHASGVVFLAHGRPPYGTILALAPLPDTHGSRCRLRRNKNKAE
jgi:UDP-glucuronate decarboxylase